MVMNVIMLDQARRGRKTAIKLNPATLSVTYPVLTDNGYGKKIKTSTLSKTVSNVRIAHHKSDIPSGSKKLTPETTSSVMYLISDQTEPLGTDWTFEYNGRNYVTDNPESQTMYGGIIGYRAKLRDITPEA